MASQGFNTSQLQAFGRDLLRSGEAYSKKEKKFLQKEGSKLRRRTKKEAKRVGKKTGSYLESLKRGKVYRYHGSQAVRVYSSAHHAHLIENGYRLILPNGRECGFVPGKHVFEAAARDFESQYLGDLNDFLEGAVRL